MQNLLSSRLNACAMPLDVSIRMTVPTTERSKIRSRRDADMIKEEGP